MTSEEAAPAGRGRVHVVGAGLAGLAAATDLAGQGYAVVLYEAGGHAGGRCRSFFDAELGVRIDNGNHLLLSGNVAALDYIRHIDALHTFERAEEAAIPFVDLATGARWVLRPSPGRLPWWLLRRDRRVPGTRASDYLSALRLCRAAPGDTVAGVLAPESILFRRLWQPLTVAALNTGAADASARLLWRVFAETLGRGAAACRPLVPREGLSESLIDPALAFLSRHRTTIRFGARLRALTIAEDRVSGLLFDGAAIPLAPGDSAILAVPAAAAARLVPGLVVPDDHAPIVNAHFRFVMPASAASPLLVGVVGGTAEWVFRKREVISVTVSAADRLVEHPADELRDLLWRDVARALDLMPGTAPPARIVKERRATFRATPAQLRRRPAAATPWTNLHLAGDYVETCLPATIEGAIRSGVAAAAAAARTARVRQVVGLASATGAGQPAASPPPPAVEARRGALP
jgi:hydroxysqualene dehydroxylase